MSIEGPEILESDWRALEEHFKRDAVIVISQELDLLQVARLVIADDKIQIEQWIASGYLAKPSSAQIEGWRRQPQTPFRFVVAQPFVIAQLQSN